MDERSLTAGLRADRYVKAHRLAEAFEDAVFERLDAACTDVHEARPDALDEFAPLEHRRSSKAVVSSLRTEAEMALETDATRTLVFGLEWVDPATQPLGEGTVTPETLCYVYHAVTGATDAAYAAMAAATRDEERWAGVRLGEAIAHPDGVVPGIAYWPVETGQDVEEGLSVLADHAATVYVPVLSV